MILKCLAAALCAGCLLGASPVGAVSSDFTFGAAARAGASLTFAGSGGRSVTATAVDLSSASTVSLVVEAPTLGLGVLVLDGPCDPLSGDDCAAEIDNIASNEALVFDFGRPAFFDEALILLAQGDDDYEFFGTDDPSVLGLAGAGRGALESLAQSLAAGSGSGVGFPALGVALDDPTPFRFLVATTAAPGTPPDDGYSIVAINGVTSVPVPPALPLAAVGLGALAWAGRRRPGQSVRR